MMVAKVKVKKNKASSLICLSSISLSLSQKILGQILENLMSRNKFFPKKIQFSINILEGV